MPLALATLRLLSTTILWISWNCEECLRFKRYLPQAWHSYLYTLIELGYKRGNSVMIDQQPPTVQSLFNEQKT